MDLDNVLGACNLFYKIAVSIRDLEEELPQIKPPAKSISSGDIFEDLSPTEEPYARMAQWFYFNSIPLEKWVAGGEIPKIFSSLKQGIELILPKLMQTEADKLISKFREEWYRAWHASGFNEPPEPPELKPSTKPRTYHTRGKHLSDINRAIREQIEFDPEAYRKIRDRFPRSLEGEMRPEEAAAYLYHVYGFPPHLIKELIMDETIDALTPEELLARIRNYMAMGLLGLTTPTKKYLGKRQQTRQQILQSHRPKEESPAPGVIRRRRRAARFDLLLKIALDGSRAAH
jgi:hypothetical protein